jgi:hypothetical protein
MNDDQLIWEAYGNPLKPMPNSAFGNNVYKMDINKDEFIHFTRVRYALQIVKEKRIRLDIEGTKKFGAYANFAVSLVYGKYLPTVQTNHIKPPLVGVVFKTRDIPYFGYSSEVAWEGDIKLINPRPVNMEEGIRLLNNSPYKIDTEDDEAIVIYDEKVTLDRNERMHQSWNS